MECHALSQVTNHAPNRPRSTPSSGLDTANQNGIISLNEMVSRATFGVWTIVFMPFTLLFDSVAAIARVWDSGVPLLTQSLLPPQDENQVVTPSARPREIRDSPPRRRRERFIAAQQLAELKLPTMDMCQCSKRICRSCRSCCLSCSEFYKHRALTALLAVHNTYLPVSVLPALIAFPKKCKHKH
jgi:hypothetical protein